MKIQILKGYENRFRLAIADAGVVLPLEAITKIALVGAGVDLNSADHSAVFDLTTYPKVLQITINNELDVGRFEAHLIVYSADHPDGRPFPSDMDAPIEIEVFG